MYLLSRGSTDNKSLFYESTSAIMLGIRVLQRVAKPSPSNTMTRPLTPSSILPLLGSFGHGVLTKAELPALELYGCSMLGPSPLADQKPEV